MARPASRIGRTLGRWVLITHRYLGVGVGLLMLVWCLSGFVMMYQGYPRLTETERLQGLQGLDLSGCCVAATEALGDGEAVEGFRIEMLEGRPVMRLSAWPPPERTIDLRSGAEVPAAGSETALAVARTYAAGHGLSASPGPPTLIDKDQWTLEGAGARGPVFRVPLGDRAGGVLYVAQATGEATQDTNRRERVLSWMGAVPHWLYPTALRQNGALWSEVVVWTSLIGCFLTATGVYVGVTRFRRRRDGRWSPYRGWSYWHHIVGLAFGVLTLTWVMSGLFTMNPWGFLDSPFGLAERGRLAGAAPRDQVVRFLAAAPSAVRGDIVQLKAAPLGGRLFVTAVSRDGRAVRLDADGRAAPLRSPEIDAAFAAMGESGARAELLTREDAYYYSGYQNPVELPVWRVRLDRPGAPVLYLDARTGQVINAVDPARRASRWLRTGLHDLDFAWMRRRPVWDAIVLLLLAGVTVGVATGTWIAFRRVGRDAARLSLWSRRFGRARRA